MDRNVMRSAFVVPCFVLNLGFSMARPYEPSLVLCVFRAALSSAQLLHSSWPALH